MNRFLSALALALALALAFGPHAAAQTGTPPAGRTGTVTGQIASGTPGGEVPGDLAVMLHAWDASGETLMKDGKADSSGAFRFDGVPMQDGWTFAAMLSYKEVTFFSEPAEVRPETKELSLPPSRWPPADFLVFWREPS